MEFTIHNEILLSVFAIAAVMGAIANKTNFCTMGAVSDWINMEDKGRLRAWLLAIAVALGGVLVLEATGKVNLSGMTFPPYRTANFAWLRYLLGGAMFGIGMTLASGCGNKTLVRIGGGNLKSLVVLAIASIMAYFMLWSDFYGIVFDSWMAPLAVNLGTFGAKSQTVDAVIGGLAGIESTDTLHLIVGAVIVVSLLAYAFASAEFRANRDNILGGAVIGLAVVAGWYLTGGATGTEWKEWAEMADVPPSRVEVQSFTFISPMGDSVRYLTHPGNFSLINFGIAALAGVIVGSFLYAIITRKFRIEWFVNLGDFANHALGAVLMGVGGVLAMGCTVGQAITGISSLAVGSILAFVSIVAGAVATMKYQYWKMMREA
ncbi:MAG: YeeE/YedE family protein [Gammaproteobacteria bacterium]|nr:YeeE/YedE family protein [Gammaproteobacteria bacterium]MBU1416367.1 YeeE/YedE family protein [Gammaproteobacteria bacterium]